VALENRLHAVQRKMISIFADRHVRQQARPWQPLLNGRRRFLCCRHTTPFRTSVLGANFFNDLQGSGNKRQSLADILPDLAHGHLALPALALRFFQVKHHPATLQ
jgi:hypothetical protein